MESDQAGHEVILAARSAPYHPAVALLTAFPVDEADWQSLGAHQLLLKPMQTRVMLEQIENLFATHEQRLAKLAAPATPAPKTKVLAKKAIKKVAKKIAKPAKKAVTKSAKKAEKKTAVTKSAKKSAKLTSPSKTVRKSASKPTKKSAQKPASKKTAR
jgi:DNA-binding response OmpR family regulator